MSVAQNNVGAIGNALFAEGGASWLPWVLGCACVVLAVVLFLMGWRNKATRRRAQEDIHLLEEKIGAVFAASPDGIMILDTNARIVFASRACSQFKTRESEDMSPGASLLEIVEEPEVGKFKLLMEEMFKGKKPVISPRKRVREDGSVFWVELRGSAVLDKQGVVCAYILLFRDVTERMEAECRLEERKATLEEAYNRITKLQNDMLSICAWTKQVNIDGKWVSVDEYLTKNLGLKLTHGISEEGIAILKKEVSFMNSESEEPQAKG